LKVLTVVGARPQFIKSAPVSRQLRGDAIDETIVHTGQHHDPELSDIFFSELQIEPPKHHLGIHGGSHGEMTGRMLTELEKVMVSERPSLVLVYGDTNSTLAGALAASKLSIPIAHVEAGLRSFNRGMPEEINRVVTDHLSSLLFCPTSTSVANLEAEGIVSGIHFIGDVMYDAAITLGGIARARSDILRDLRIDERGYSVATIHRAENTDDPKRLSQIVAYLNAEARELPIILPMHPRTRAAVERHATDLSGLRVIPPLGYLDMTRLVQGASCVYTDSGGLQKEAYFHRVPCVTLRGETEWVETVEAGWNRLWTYPTYMPRRDIDDYGDGTASKRLVALIQDAGL